jgi:hypothetical protein
MPRKFGSTILRLVVSRFRRQCKPGIVNASRERQQVTNLTTRLLPAVMSGFLVRYPVGKIARTSGRKMLLGTIVNTRAIVAGSLVGLFFSRFVPKRHADTMLQAVAFAIILIGLKMAWKTDDFILLICSEGVRQHYIIKDQLNTPPLASQLVLPNGNFLTEIS